MSYIARLSALALFAAVCFAKPNFTGTWKLNAAKSDFGPLPAPEKMIRSIQHEEPNLKIQTEQSGPQGEIKSELNYTTDGKEFTNKTRAGEAKGTAAWEGDILLVKSKRTIQGMEIEQTDRWTMGEDGKTMQVKSNLKTPQGELDLTISFEKQ